MATEPYELDCPSCAATVRTDLDAILADGGERLRGRDLVCRACGHEFGVFVL
jgi:transcriptional regulator NrdR family protein